MYVADNMQSERKGSHKLDSFRGLLPSSVKPQLKLDGAELSLIVQFSHHQKVVIYLKQT